MKVTVKEGVNSPVWYSSLAGEQFEVVYYDTNNSIVYVLHESSSMPRGIRMSDCNVHMISYDYYTDIPHPDHYDNSRGSLYQFAVDHDLNAYEFDIIKRVVRCRKKGQFREDLEKTKTVIDLYLTEQI